MSDDAGAGPEDRGHRPRWARRLPFALPAVAFAALAVALAAGLQRDPSLVPSPLIGKPAPGLELAPVPGFGPGASSDEFAGRAVLVNVFASWCVSCRHEHPLLMRLAREGVDIVGLAHKDAADDAAAWLAGHGNPYSATGLDLDGRASIEWGVYGVPETFLVGPDGVIAWKHVGPLDADIVEQALRPRLRALAVAAEPAAAVRLVADEAPRSAPATLDNLVWLDEPRPLPETPFFVEGGREARFSDYAGRAIVLNLWATWCPPCRHEMPSLDRLAARHGGADLVVMTLSLDSGDAAERILAFYDEIGASHLGLYHDPSMSVSRALGVFGLPTTLLIDHRGRVVAELTGTAEWDGPEALAVILPLAEAARAARTPTSLQARVVD